LGFQYMDLVGDTYMNVTTAVGILFSIFFKWPNRILFKCLFSDFELQKSDDPDCIVIMMKQNYSFQNAQNKTFHMK
jgi:hypothetical protein